MVSAEEGSAEDPSRFQVSENVQVRFRWREELEGCPKQTWSLEQSLEGGEKCVISVREKQE